jgi:hypothetical protein
MLAVFGLIVAVLWMAVPFILLGIKNRLQVMIDIEKAHEADELYFYTVAPAAEVVTK